MAHITISYRRADSDAIAGRIRDRIAAHFGDESVFMDIDSIPFGFDFRDHIQEALAQNDILVAIIGPKWLGPGKGAGLRIMEQTEEARLAFLRNAWAAGQASGDAGPADFADIKAQGRALLKAAGK